MSSTTVPSTPGGKSVSRRARGGPRTYLAFLGSCLYEDPVTRRALPRNYVEVLEARLAYVENFLRQQQPHTVSGLQEPQSASMEVGESMADDQEELSKDENDLEDLQDLASKVGTLSLNAAGAEPQYLGSSSAFAFARLVKPILGGTNHVISQVTESSAIEPNTPATCPLPDPLTALTLSNAYFDNVNTQYPFLHEPEFRAWESSIVLFQGEWPNSEFDPVPFFFLNMVYAVGALLIPQTEYTAERLYESAMYCIDPILSRDSTRSIQAILCCAAFSLRASVGTSHWKLAGLAVRQCVDLGFHRSVRIDPTPDLLRSEIRKRVFWSAYSMECASCVHLGRPMSLHYHEIDAELPIDADDSYIVSGGKSGRLRLNIADPPTNITRAIWSIRLRALQGQIHSALYCDTRISNTSSLEQLETVEKLRQDLEAWRASVPDLQPPSGTALSLFMTSDWPLLVYNQAVLQLYRPQLTTREGIRDKSTIVTQCASFSAEACRAYRRQYFGKPTTYTWGALHELFLAGLTFIFCVRQSPAVRDQLGYESISKTCTDCTITFVILAERWNDAAPYRDLFEALSSSVLRLVSRPAGPELTSTRTDEAQESNLLADESDFAKILANFTDEIDASSQVDTMLDAIMMDWTQY